MTTCAPALAAMADCNCVSHLFHLKAHFTAVAFPIDHAPPPIHQSAECAIFCRFAISSYTAAEEQASFVEYGSEHKKSRLLAEPAFFKKASAFYYSN